ncbi:MAG: alpha/beta hydrolase [Cellvibrionaceae bacterium]
MIDHCPLFIDHCPMHTMSWRGVRLKLQAHNVQVGTQQLELRRCYRDNTGPPVLLLADFLHTSEIFLPRKGGEGGLAPFLASLGYDVYLAELRGRGNSWPGISDTSDWGLHEAICEDIPAHLRTLEKLRPGQSQIWMGQGLGGLLLAASYARLENRIALAGMVHFAVARRLRLETQRRVLARHLWHFGPAAINLFCGYAAIPFSKPCRCETRKSLATWLQWQGSEGWLDPLDGFDYARALRERGLPPSLYFANGERALWGSVQDCRNWIAELGAHDCRLVTISSKGGNLHDYSHADLLQHPEACDDHFLQLQQWLAERTVRSEGPPPKAAITC